MYANDGPDLMGSHGTFLDVFLVPFSDPVLGVKRMCQIPQIGGFNIYPSTNMLLIQPS